jgi:hypothetical protein
LRFSSGGVIAKRTAVTGPPPSRRAKQDDLSIKQEDSVMSLHFLSLAAIASLVAGCHAQRLRRGHVFGFTAECGRRRACSHNPRVLPRYGRTPESVSTIQRTGTRACIDVFLLLPATVSVQRSQPNVARGSDRAGQANTRV